MVQLACILIALGIILVCLFIRKKLDERSLERIGISKQIESYVPEPNPAHISQSKLLGEPDIAESTLNLRNYIRYSDRLNYLRNYGTKEFNRNF